MRIRVGRTDIVVTYGFFFMITIYLLSDLSGTATAYLTAVLVHEMGHILYMKVAQVRLKEIHFTLAGINIKANNLSKLSYRQEICLAFFGPLFNLLAICICWTFFKHSGRAQFFSIINLFLAIYNLLPIRSLDGGRIARVMLQLRFSERTVYYVTTFLSMLSVLCVVLFTIVSIQTVGFSFPLVVACCYLAYFALMK